MVPKPKCKKTSTFIVLVFANFMRISTPYSKDFVKTALKSHRKLLTHILQDVHIPVKPDRLNLYGEDVRMVDKLTKPNRILTPTEKDEIVTRYESGLSMENVAKECGCHHTTVGRILRARGVAIRA